MKLRGFDEPRVFPPDLCLFACLNCVLDEVKQIPPLIGSCTIVQQANLARRIKEETARRRLSVRFYYIKPRQAAGQGCSFGELPSQTAENNGFIHCCRISAAFIRGCPLCPVTHRTASYLLSAGRRVSTL